MLVRIQESNMQFAQGLMLGSQIKQHEKVLKKELEPLQFRTVTDRIEAEQFARRRIGQNLTKDFPVIFVAGVPGEQKSILDATFQWYKGILIYRDAEVWRSYKNSTISIEPAYLGWFIQDALLPPAKPTAVSRLCTAED